MALTVGVKPTAGVALKLGLTAAKEENTTIVALFLSAVLVFLLHVVRSYEEKSLNLAGSYCLRNLINRLYTGGDL